MAATSARQDRSRRRGGSCAVLAAGARVVSGAGGCAGSLRVGSGRLSGVGLPPAYR